MEQSNAATFDDSRDSDKPEVQFLGFDTNDEVLGTIKNKITCINKIFHLDIPEPIEVDTKPSDNSFVLSTCNTDVCERNKSLALSKTNDKKHSLKRIKKKDTCNVAEESFEPNIQPYLEITTPTFDLTSSSPRIRRNIDINKPIFRIPFEQGWKRELVYRTVPSNKSSSDVYYHSPPPLKKKLRSWKDIDRILNKLPNNTLTIDNFTFAKQPIGLNDPTKELIRNAFTETFKKDSFYEVTVRNENVGTSIPQPDDYELSENKNIKTSSKTKNVKERITRSKINKSNEEDTSITLKTPEYITEDCEAIQSSIVPAKLPSKSDAIETSASIDEKRLSKSDGELILQAPCGIRCADHDKPATLMCAQCMVYYHPACVNLNANLTIAGYVCENCRSLKHQRNRCVQSSDNVDVSIAAPEQLHVEPICIQKVHQTSDTTNVFINDTPTSKLEELSYEIYNNVDENAPVLNSVTCQETMYKTSMVDDNFHEQNEMIQTPGPSAITCVVKESKNFNDYSTMIGTLPQILTPTISSFQSVNFMVKAMKDVFKYLNTYQLLIASQVCTSWNLIAMDKVLWQTVDLNGLLVRDWNKFITLINKQQTVTLDTTNMLIFYKTEIYERSWLHFSAALRKTTKLKKVKLYRCPAHVVEDTIYALPQLEVLNATTIVNPYFSNETSNTSELMVLNLNFLGQMSNLTELRIKSLSGIKIITLPSFENLINLKYLSLTSIKQFPKDISNSLNTVSTNLEVLEIGDCDCLSKDFAGIIKKLFNLTSLRMENCLDRWESFAQEVFDAIRSHENLKILELIQIKFSNTVKDGLEKCDRLKVLFISPVYDRNSATINCRLIDCLKKLSTTLTYLVWVLTLEILQNTDLFITQYQQKQYTFNFSADLSQIAKKRTNNISLRRTMSGETSKDEKDKQFNIDVISVSALKKLLKTLMVGVQIKVVKIPLSQITHFSLSEEFNKL